MQSNFKIHLQQSDQVFEMAAGFLIGRIRQNQDISLKTLVLLSGGSTVNLYGRLADFIKSSAGDFGFLTFAQADERFRPENNDDINAKVIAGTGLNEACKQKGIKFFTVSQNPGFEDSVSEYNVNMTKLFKENTYKTAILGIGPDGHTAGLLPGHRMNWERQDMAVGYENVGSYKKRITLTPYAIRQLDLATVVAKGPEKQEALSKIFGEVKLTDTDKFPGLIIREIKEADLFTDVKI